MCAFFAWQYMSFVLTEILYQCFDHLVTVGSHFRVIFVFVRFLMKIIDINSEECQNDKPQHGRPKRAELSDVNINTGMQSINSERASLMPSPNPHDLPRACTHMWHRHQISSTDLVWSNHKDGRWRYPPVEKLLSFQIFQSRCYLHNFLQNRACRKMWNSFRKVAIFRKFHHLE